MALLLGKRVEGVGKYVVLDREVFAEEASDVPMVSITPELFNNTY